MFNNSLPVLVARIAYIQWIEPRSTGFDPTWLNKHYEYCGNVHLSWCSATLEAIKCTPYNCLLMHMCLLIQLCRSSDYLK